MWIREMCCLNDCSLGFEFENAYIWENDKDRSLTVKPWLWCTCKLAKITCKWFFKGVNSPYMCLQFTFSRSSFKIAKFTFVYFSVNSRCAIDGFDFIANCTHCVVHIQSMLTSFMISFWRFKIEHGNRNNTGNRCWDSTQKFVEAFDIKMSYFATKNVLFRHRFPLLFLLPRLTIWPS